MTELEKEADLYASIMSWDEEVDTWEDIAERAYLAGAKAHLPQWHDLRKDPRDLPKRDCEVIILHENGHKNIQKWEKGSWTNAIINPVIAWCEIPKFEE